MHAVRPVLEGVPRREAVDLERIGVLEPGEGVARSVGCVVEAGTVAVPRAARGRVRVGMGLLGVEFQKRRIGARLDVGLRRVQR